MPLGFRADTCAALSRYPEQVTFQPRVNSNSAATAKLKMNSHESHLPVEKRCALQALIPLKLKIFRVI